MDFANAVAAALRGIRQPHGTVLGLEGQWGSGKSGVVNLVTKRLSETANDVHVVVFNPWWFTNANDLTAVFFGEIAAALGGSFSGNVKSSLRALGLRLGQHSGLIGNLVDFATIGVPSGLSRSAIESVSSLVHEDRSVTEEHGALASALDNQSRRILVIIDDLDRIQGAQALEMIKLVKAAGQLPNVMYLLVYDRKILDRALAHLAPEEGPHYLEKIVQASFALPPANREDLRRWLFEGLGRVFGVAETGPKTHLPNLYYSLVDPCLHSPRDVVRLLNAVSVSWPAISNVANAADLLSLEALKLFRPSVYSAIQTHRDVVLTGEKRGPIPVEFNAEYLDKILLVDVPERDKSELRDGLSRLFPMLSRQWADVTYGSDFADEWRRDRRVCSETYFDFYFSLSIAEQSIILERAAEILDAETAPARIIEILLEMVGTIRKAGGTMAAVLLEELRARGDKIDESRLHPLLEALFEVADRLMVPEDESFNLFSVDNERRLHWLVNALVRDRYREDEVRRDEILEPVASTAALGWAADFVSRCVKNHDSEKRDPSDALVSKQCAERLRVRVLDRLDRAAEDGALLTVPNIIGTLAHWMYLGGDERDQVAREWVERQVQDPSILAEIAEKIVGRVRTEGAGDWVAVTHYVVKPDRIAWLVDPDEFLTRVDAALGELPEDDKESRPRLQRFRDAWGEGQKGRW
ncbi:MAG: KAP family NTPase [Alphaproteobacteria bacterium]|nr:KAP family NTPase [Alphaproteobacteria bacterium]